MKFKLLGALLGVGLVILAFSCHLIPLPIPREPVVDPQDGSISTRWIGFRTTSGGGCPNVTGWQGEPLLSRALASDAQVRELGLDRFCAYTPEAGSHRPFVAPAGLTAARDRLAISVAGGGTEPGSPLASEATLSQVDGALAQEFLSQAGALPGLSPGPSNVQITVLDSEPDGSPGPSPAAPDRQHGFAISQLAQELVCQGSSCAATVRTRRVLDYDDPNQLTSPLDPGVPGTVGRISDLGTAITTAVLSPHEKNLILNLSLGWDGEEDLARARDAKQDGGLDATALYVYKALQLTAKKNVLVTAAAGNRRGGSLDDSKGPILPAAWDSSPAGSSLVYAVGGVDWQGLPLPNSRTHGLPSRVAYGDHATARVNGQFTTVYTGTSISTAVVSATAAVIWHLRPELKPADVMQLIDSSGEPQPVLADFYPKNQGLAPQIREISLCAAVKQACDNGHCSVTDCTPLGHKPPEFSSLLTPTPAADAGTRFHPAQFPSFWMSSCRPGTHLLAAGLWVPQPICPTDQYRSVSSGPWIFPQPGDDPCPNCTLVPTGPPKIQALAAGSGSPGQPPAVAAEAKHYQLEIMLNPVWGNASHIASLAGLKSPAMLDIDCFVPGQPMTRTTYQVPIDPTAGMAWTAFGFGNGQSLAGCRAQLNFIVADATGARWSIQNPVMVDPGPGGATKPFRP